MSSSGRRSGPPDITPQEAHDRYLDKLRAERTDATLSSYHYRLKLFVEWAEQRGIERMQDLSGWDIENYETHRRSKDAQLLTLNKELGTVKNWLQYCADIEIVDEDLPEKVHVPDIPKGARSSDVKLAPADAIDLLNYYRGSPEDYGTRAHVLLELLWHVGARAGALVALDVRDMREHDDGTRYLEFDNRPETGTRLKKGPDGERPVLLPDAVWDALDHYVERNRNDVRDDAGRQPLLAARTGRPTPGTIRDWTYVATFPCVHSPCPHDKNPDYCEWTTYSRGSQCPSSRSPHQVRTGAITWMLNRGVPLEVVAERVNSSPETIRKHYDKEDPVSEMLHRRSTHLGSLEIDDDSTNHE